MQKNERARIIIIQIRTHHHINHERTAWGTYTFFKEN